MKARKAAETMGKGVANKAGKARTAPKAKKTANRKVAKKKLPMVYKAEDQGQPQAQTAGGRGPGGPSTSIFSPAATRSKSRTAAPAKTKSAPEGVAKRGPGRPKKAATAPEAAPTRSSTASGTRRKAPTSPPPEAPPAKKGGRPNRRRGPPPTDAEEAEEETPSQKARRAAKGKAPTVEEKGVEDEDEERMTQPTQLAASEILKKRGPGRPRKEAGASTSAAAKGSSGAGGKGKGTPQKGTPSRAPPTTRLRDGSIMRKDMKIPGVESIPLQYMSDSPPHKHKRPRAAGNGYDSGDDVIDLPSESESEEEYPAPSGEPHLITLHLANIDIPRPLLIKVFSDASVSTLKASASAKTRGKMTPEMIAFRYKGVELEEHTRRGLRTLASYGVGDECTLHLRWLSKRQVEAAEERRQRMLEAQEMKDAARALQGAARSRAAREEDEYDYDEDELESPRAKKAKKANATPRPKGRAGVDWSLDDVEALVAGVEGVGQARKWGSDAFSSLHERGRTALDLKDKWRNLIKCAERGGGGQRKGGAAVPTSVLDRVLKFADSGHRKSQTR